jgi:putative tryptophan/tyrosine transport system substrate-binding protein
VSPPITRRQLIWGAGLTGLGLAAGCGRLPWQTQPKIHRIGYLSGTTPATAASLTAAFQEGLREHGWVDGHNVAIEYRWAEGRPERFPELTAELVGLQMDVLVIASVAMAQVARDTTSTIPIVVAGSEGDLVASGLAASYAHPGGTVTGLSNLSAQLAGKRLQLLKEAVPGISRVAVLWHTSVGPFWRDGLAAAAEDLGVQLELLEVRGPDEFDSVFEVAGERANGLFHIGSALSYVHRARIGRIAAQYRLPAMYDRREYVEDGGLMAYQPIAATLYRRAAYYVDRILRGANPADLPVEQPMTFEFVVNMKTAQALGITFPNEIMLQVTEVIQ